jgi:Flp pilus assembly protein TadD
MASYAGLRVASLGLWATYPAEPVNGELVSDRLFSFLYQEDAAPPGVVFPASQEAGARAVLQRVEAAVNHGELRRYLPWLTADEYARHEKSDDPYAHPVSALRRILVETRVYDELAQEVAQREHPDLLIVYFQGSDSIGHVFAPYAPPRQPAISEEDYGRYHGVPQLYFEELDALLGRYRRLAKDQGAVLMVASDHGFTWAEGRPTRLSSFATATAAKWHRKEGIYLLWGEGVGPAPGHASRGKVGQVCATVLSLLGLPPAGYLQGPALPGAPAGAALEKVDYRAFYKPSSIALAINPAADKETLARLKALGYVGAAEPASAPKAALGSRRTAGSFNNEGLILRDQGKPDEARAAFEKALAIDPGLASALWNLSELLFEKERDLERSDELLLKAFAAGFPDGTRLLIGRAIGYQRIDKLERSLKLLAAAKRARPDEPELWLFEGRFLVERGDCAAALSDFRAAVKLAPDNAAGFASLGLAQLCLGDRAGARRSFDKSLQLDPAQPKLQEYLR